MARSIATPVAPSYAGAVATPTAPNADGDVIPVGGSVRLLVIAGATPTTVTIPTPATQDGLPVGDGGGTVAANTARLFGPFPARLFAQATDAPAQSGVAVAGKVLVDYSSVATITRVVLA